nr:probable 28S ribosomal protein S23, mitochondrial [Onthophagus taurus]
MANSRLEKIGTIYTRAKGLIDSGARNWVDRPLWFDVYEAFPPKEEPRFDKKVPKCELKKIFYQEDEIRRLGYLAFTVAHKIECTGEWKIDNGEYFK